MILLLALAVCASCAPTGDASPPKGFVPVEPATYTRALGKSDLFLDNPTGDSRENVDYVTEWIEEHEAKVTVPYEFYMARRHVTNGEFAEFVRETGYKTTVLRDSTGYIVSHDGVWTQGALNSWQQTLWDLYPNEPVVQISWYDAMAYAGWKSAQIGMEVRLPTLEEWELAARDPNRLGPGAWPWGERFDESKANCADRAYRPYLWRHKAISDGTRYVNPSKRYPANGRGIRDAVGNVWTWLATPESTRDATGGTYTAATDHSSWPEPSRRMSMAGGCFASRLAHCNLLAPMGHPARDGSFDVGFRLVAIP